jgi:hypothetical protein
VLGRLAPSCVVPLVLFLPVLLAIVLSRPRGAAAEEANRATPEKPHSNIADTKRGASNDTSGKRNVNTIMITMMNEINDQGVT